MTTATDADRDLLIIGGGVMGLFTAYCAAAHSATVTVIERGRIGDPATASYGRTRSYRSDYLDADYGRLAFAAQGLWNDFEDETHSTALVRCGCMNIANSAVTPDLAETYAERSFAILTELGLRTESFDGAAVTERFPYLDADLARVDVDAGVVDLATVTRTLLAALAERGVIVREHVAVSAVEQTDGRFIVSSDAGDFSGKSLAVTAGHGTNEVLAMLRGCPLQVPITKDRPSEARYFWPADPAEFNSSVMPVIAYLDTGIYVHPIIDGVSDAVKVGYYNPPDMPRGATSIDSIDSFLAQCMPGLIGARSAEITDVDQCDYDLVADDHFVLGAVPGAPGAYVGVGWRGTGYKFAPWVGKVLADLAGGREPGYDIGRFDPARFVAPLVSAGAPPARAAVR